MAAIVLVFFFARATSRPWASCSLSVNKPDVVGGLAFGFDRVDVNIGRYLREANSASARFQGALFSSLIQGGFIGKRPSVVWELR